MSLNGKLNENEALLLIEVAPVENFEMGYVVLPFVTVIDAGTSELRQHIENLQMKRQDHDPVGLVAYPDGYPLIAGQEVRIQFQGHIWGSENECTVVQII